MPSGAGCRTAWSSGGVPCESWRIAPRNIGISSGRQSELRRNFTRNGQRSRMAVRDATCAVALIEWLNESPGAVELSAFRAAHPWTRLVLITRVDGENALVAPSVADSIVWIRHANTVLAKALRTPSCVLRSRVARHIRQDVECSKRTKLALLEAANVDPPIRTVAEWAGRLATTTRTLERWFARDFTSGITPKFFLDSMVLLWARERFRTASSWAGLGNRADSDPEMLKGTALKLIGESSKANVAGFVRHPGGGRRLSPEMVHGNVLAEGLAALLRPRQ